MRFSNLTDSRCFSGVNMTGRNDLCARHIRPLIPISAGLDPDLSKMRRFSAMLFDVYGTLLISGAGDTGLNRGPTGKKREIRGLLKRFGIYLTPDCLANALKMAVKGYHAIAHRQGIDYPEVDIVQVWQQILSFDDVSSVKDFALEYELIVNPVYPMPGLAELLHACNRRQVPLGIISNAQFYTVDVLECLLGATLDERGFDQRLLFFSWREGRAKPASFMFDRAKAVLASMGIPAASVVYVGNDMRNDILPAATVGFTTALFAGDRRSLRLRQSDRRCLDVRPDMIITDLRQLIADAGNP
jgi:putative hydrolase of the HAD superfamily